MLKASQGRGRAPARSEENLQRTLVRLIPLPLKFYFPAPLGKETVLNAANK